MDFLPACAVAYKNLMKKANMTTNNNRKMIYTHLLVNWIKIRMEFITFDKKIFK